MQMLNFINEGLVQPREVSGCMKGTVAHGSTFSFTCGSATIISFFSFLWLLLFGFCSASRYCDAWSLSLLSISSCQSFCWHGFTYVCWAPINWCLNLWRLLVCQRPIAFEIIYGCRRRYSQKSGWMMLICGTNPFVQSGSQVSCTESLNC